MVGNFQGVDGVAHVLTENRLTSSPALISVKLAPVTPAKKKKKRFKGLKRELLGTNRLNQELTLFFSNFQFSSWVRICSTTDMASRPCFTYSFSWKQRRQRHVRDEEVLSRTPQTNPPPTPKHLTCAVTALRPRPSSSRSSSEPADKRSEDEPQSASAAPPTETRRDLLDHLPQTRVGSRTGRPKWRGGRSWGLVRRRRSLLLNRLQVKKKNAFKCVFSGSDRPETELSPRSSSASCVSTLKSRNQVSSQATTNDVIGST